MAYTTSLYYEEEKYGVAQVLTAAFNATTEYTSGAAAWHWFPSEYWDNLTGNEGNLTDYGRRIADLISDPTGQY